MLLWSLGSMNMVCAQPEVCDVTSISRGLFCLELSDNNNMPTGPSYPIQLCRIAIVVSRNNMLACLQKAAVLICLAGTIIS